MQLSILLAVLASVMISEHVPQQPVDGATERVLMTLATSLCAVLLATWGSLTISGVMRAGQAHDRACLRWLSRLAETR